MTRISVPCGAGGRLVAETSIDGRGLVVTYTDHDLADLYGRTYVAHSGGEWRLDRRGDLAQQITGTCDVSAPRSSARIRRWLAARARKS